MDTDHPKIAREIERMVRRARGADTDVEETRLEAVRTLLYVGDTESLPLLEEIKRAQPRVMTIVNWRDYPQSAPKFTYVDEAIIAEREINRREERRKLIIEMRGMKTDTERIEFLVEEAYGKSPSGFCPRCDAAAFLLEKQFWPLYLMEVAKNLDSWTREAKYRLISDLGYFPQDRLDHLSVIERVFQQLIKDTDQEVSVEATRAWERLGASR